MSDHADLTETEIEAAIVMENEESNKSGRPYRDEVPFRLVEQLDWNPNALCRRHGCKKLTEIQQSPIGKNLVLP
jgi:hypothetical protein